MSQESSSERRFLVTGAKGCIGAWVVKNLIERGDRPCVFDRDKNSHRLAALLSIEQMAALDLIRGDITRFEDLERAVTGRGITHIIHLAALQVPFCAADPPLGALVNVVGTLNVFEVARRYRSLVKRIVYASSAAVFGPEEFYGAGRVPEGAALDPTTHYGVFKQANEGNARVFFATDGISSAGLRPWAVYGVGRDQGLTSGPTKAIKAAAVGRPYTIRFTGGIDLQYANDTAQIFIRAAESELEGARVYTLRGSVTETESFLAELARFAPGSRDLVRASGPKLPIAPDLDDSAAVRDLGEPPRTALADGIRQTLELFERLHRAGQLDTRDLES